MAKIRNERLEASCPVMRDASHSFWVSRIQTAIEFNCHCKRFLLCCYPNIVLGTYLGQPFPTMRSVMSQLDLWCSVKEAVRDYGTDRAVIKLARAPVLISDGIIVHLFWYYGSMPQLFFSSCLHNLILLYSRDDNLLVQNYYFSTSYIFSKCFCSRDWLWIWSMDNFD